MKGKGVNMKIKNGLFFIPYTEMEVMENLTNAAAAWKPIGTRREKQKAKKDRLKALAILSNATESIKATKWASKQTPQVSHQSILTAMRHSTHLTHTHLFFDTGRTWVRGGRKPRKLKVKLPPKPEAPFKGIEPQSLEAEYCDFLDKGRNAAQRDTAELFIESADILNEPGD
jgi:hypothetical protein